MAVKHFAWEDAFGDTDVRVRTAEVEPVSAGVRQFTIVGNLSARQLRRLEARLNNPDGCSVVPVHAEEGTVSIGFDAGRAFEGDFEYALRRMGYNVR